MPSPAVTLLLLALATTAWASTGQKKKVSDWSDKYDVHFKKYAKHYFGPGLDWRWFKAQAIAESGLNPKAESKSGARGIMQILPSTYREIQKKNPHMQDMDSPRWNIAAGVYYDRTLYKRWESPPPGDERLYFAFGSYNAGYTRIKNTYQRVDLPSASWDEVAPHVPGQTRHYVRRIRRLMDKH
ncbi:MAG TPA: transglycosylase SLT domain-containing protein [Gammaproteobacteria bacterium]|nr:transglycosylase SLT domain-containing protein [Gammaproteobacteria bacterium]